MDPVTETQFNRAIERILRQHARSLEAYKLVKVREHWRRVKVTRKRSIW